jgi:hypothetical protein
VLERCNRTIDEHLGRMARPSQSTVCWHWAKPSTVCHVGCAELRFVLSHRPRHDTMGSFSCRPSPKSMPWRPIGRANSRPTKCRRREREGDIGEGGSSYVSYRGAGELAHGVLDTRFVRVSRSEWGGARIGVPKAGAFTHEEATAQLWPYGGEEPLARIGEDARKHNARVGAGR